jgi:hypothetical protein
MPTSCLDLKSLGHQFNGVYSVMGAKYVETVYCDFSQFNFDPSKFILWFNILICLKVGALEW